jgi:hypothetical protein
LIYKPTQKFGLSRRRQYHHHDQYGSDAKIYTIPLILPPIYLQGQLISAIPNTIDSFTFLEITYFIKSELDPSGFLDRGIDDSDSVAKRFFYFYYSAWTFAPILCP